jgi:CheY-like chemotaxis protein
MGLGIDISARSTPDDDGLIENSFRSNWKSPCTPRDNRTVVTRATELSTFSSSGFGLDISWRSTPDDDGTMDNSFRMNFLKSTITPRTNRTIATRATELSTFSSSASSIHPLSPSNDNVAPATPQLKEFNFPANENVVLVVDDNAVNRKLLGRMLQKFRLECHFCTNGKEAVDFMKQSRNYSSGDMSRPLVGLILMDWSIPVMDGCEATRTIRQELRLPYDVPILALTACAMEEGLEKFLDAGANEIATKPILRNDLLRLCEQYLLAAPPLQEKKRNTSFSSFAQLA